MYLLYFLLINNINGMLKLNNKVKRNLFDKIEIL